MQIKIPYTANIWEEGGQFIAHALPLDVASSGATAALARVALDEAVGLFLDTAREEGTLDQVLEEAGYVHLHDAWASPEWVGVEHGAVTVTA